MRRRALASLFATCVIVSAPVAASASEGEQEAERLFVEGKTLLDAGRVTAACVAFDRSNALDPAEGTLLALGLCHEREGRWRVADEELSRVLDSAKASGREDRRRVAQAALERVRTNLEREPRPATESPPPEEAEHATAHERETVASPSAETRGHVSAAQSTVPWVPISLGGAGALALITGGIFGARAYAKWGDVSARCDPNACTDAAALGDLDQARGAATASTILVGSGVILGIVAAVLYFADGRTKKSGANGRLLTFTTGPHGVAGTF